MQFKNCVELAFTFKSIGNEVKMFSMEPPVSRYEFQAENGSMNSVWKQSEQKLSGKLT